MSPKLVLLTLCLAVSTAAADDPWATPPAPVPPASPAAPAPANLPPPDAPPTDGPPPDAPPPVAPVTEPPPVARPPVAAPPVAAPPVAPPVAPVAAPAVRTRRPDDYYSRQRAHGIFHRGRLAIGAHSGDAPVMMNGAATAATEGRTMAMLAFEGAYLGLPSSFGNFHGVEFSTGMRAAPFDFWLSFGTAVTLFNIGRGGPGSLRIGGGFGAGFNLAHGYAYLRGRAAIVVLPRTLDAEVSVQWTPRSASTSTYDEQLRRISVWYRPGPSKLAWELFVEQFQRVDTSNDREREFDGFGAGIGLAK